MGLPTGVISTYYTTGNRVTITGTPGATFNYSIATNGGCGNTMLTGSVTVSSAATLALTSATGTANQPFVREMRLFLLPTRLAGVLQALPLLDFRVGLML